MGSRDHAVSEQVGAMLARIRLPGLMLNLAANIHAAAVEEMRVRLAVKRMGERYRRELGAARRNVTIGGRRG